MPATEFFGWQEFFTIYPFSEERQDARVAMLAAVIANVSGKSLKRTMRERDFLPDYLGTRPSVVVEKSLETQRAEFIAFKEKLNAVQGKTQ